MADFEINGTNGDDVFFINEAFAALVSEGGGSLTKGGGGGNPNSTTSSFYGFDFSDDATLTVDGGEGDDVYVVAGKASFDDLTIKHYSDTDAVLLTEFNEETTEITDVQDATGATTAIRFTDLGTGESFDLTLISEADGSVLGVDDLNFEQTEDGLAVVRSSSAQASGFFNNLAETDTFAQVGVGGAFGTLDDPEAEILYAGSGVEKVELSKNNEEVIVDRIGAEKDLVIEADNTQTGITLVYGDREDVTPELEECLIFDIDGDVLRARSNPDASSGNSASDGFIEVVTEEENAKVVDLQNGSYQLFAEDGTPLDLFRIEDKNGDPVAGLGDFINVIEMLDVNESGPLASNLEADLV